MDKEQPSPSKTDDSTEEEIIEDISIAEEFPSDSSDSEDIPIFLNDDSDFAQKKRQLFDIDDDNFFLGDVDNVLSADNIAKHFKPSELIKVNVDDVKENIVPSNSDNRPTIVEKPQKTVKALTESHKELSPMSDDFILINDKKVNINSLKKVQSASAVTSKVPHENASTFSSLNYPKNTPVSVRNTKSLEQFLDSNSSDESVENDNSIDEMIVERYDYNAGSSESDSEHVEKKKKKSLSEKRQETDVLEEIEEIPSEQPVKKMEKINDYLKEPLDDITEEESEAESRMSEAEKTNEAEKISVIEKGNQMRHILENSLIASKSNNTQETINADLQQKSIRELQDIVMEKDMCLDALNSELSALARRENFKDASGRESSKESIREYSIATTASTEYRTINDDFHVKILDIENELHERANCIEELNLKLNLTIQEREEIQAQSEKLAQEVLELRTKIAYIESPKSSDHQTVISMSQMNTFKKSLSEDESAAFSKVWNKFEIFHKTEIDQIKQNHDEEIKILTDQIRQEKKETEVEINRLRQLLNNVKSMSPEVDALRQELEAKHQKEMEELRQYFERRCVDMEKQYSEDVFSQHVSRVEDLNSDDSDHETLPDDEPESSKKTPKESPVHRRSLMETSALSSAIDEDEKNLKIEEMKQSHKLKMDELYQQHDGVVKELKLKLQIAEDNFKTQEIQSEVYEQENDVIISKSTLQIGDQNADTELNSIINEYERRLEEQVALAREDVLHELEVQIQALLSENSREDSHWPPELILLREKFTAKSQLEIAQLKIKHDEEMAKMKNDLDIQRKLKRHAAFDSHRDLDKIITERDNLRELSSSLRYALCELAKYFTQCEDEVNNTLLEEINKCNVSAMSNDDLNVSTLSCSTQNPRKFITFMPDISSLIAIVEDPSLMEYIAKPEENQISSLFQINIVDCLDRLKSEANNILALSEQMCKRNKFDVSIDKLSEKSDSCEEEDGLRKSHCKSLENFDSCSIIEEKTENAALSLPIFLEEAETDQLNQRMHELKHMLVKSEEQRKDLKKELVNVLKKSDSLEQELQETKSQIESLNLPKETFEGFGTQTPTNFKNKSFSLVELQEKAKNFLTTPNNTSMENVVVLIQLIEDFCRETDRYIDTEKKEREDLQLQIDAADKQLKATRLFLEDQAVERETERDEFSKEIEQLRIILKDRDKDKASQDNFQKEKLENGNGKGNQHLAKHIANLEQQIKDLTAGCTQYNEQKSKHEEDLKASLDKVFVLREIITDLETQIQSKSLNEHVLNEKCKELQNYIEMQSQANDSLKQDVEHLKGDLDSQGYTERIRYLEDQVKLTRPSAEQKLLVDQMTSQLKTIELLLDRKTKTLEAFHALASTCSTTCSTPSEDVSVRGGNELESSDISPFRTIKLSTEGSALPFEEVQRILEKLSKHNRIEEATVKKVTDLEMQVNGIKSNYNELQQEKDILQERMSEQLMKISSLQSRLDEQRLRAEELTKESQADLTIRVHDLQNELLTLKETLSARDKQIANLNHLLEQSKKIIDRQEHELAFSEDNDKSLVEKLEDELKRNIGEIQRLKDKIKTEMINKVALPDLMETMLAEKNEEIENLREQLASRDKESNVTQQNTFVKSGMVLGMISEYDEPDMLRRAADGVDCGQFQFQNQLQATSKTFDNQTFSFSNFTRSTQGELLTDKATISSLSKTDGSLINSPLQLIPRHINFTSADESSVVSEVSRLKQELEQMTVEKNQLIDSLKTDLKVKADEMSNTEIDLAAKTKLYEDLLIEKKEVERELDDFRVSIMKLSSYETTVKKKDEELSNSLIKIKQLETQLQSQNNDLENLRTVMTDKDKSLQKLTEDLEKAQEKCQINEKILQELEKLKNQVSSYDQTMVEKENLLNKLEIDLLKYVKNEKELLDKVEQCDKLLDSNQHLESNVDNLKRELSLKSFALEKCKFDLLEIEQQVKQDVMISSDNRQLTVDEIAAKLDKELNYSAELDGNILKAIESEGELEDHRRPSKYEEKMRKLEEDLDILKKQYSKISGELEEEKKNSDFIQMQDASLIEAIKIRLEAALDNENVLKRMLETERHRTESLATQLTGIQRTKSFDNYLLFNKSSVPDSPRRLAKLNEFESEVVTRLESEIKLLSSQNERERDRVVDLQKVLDRERDRFNKALADTNEYSEHMKREIKRLQHDKEQLEIELDQVHDLKMKYFDLEREKDKLMETIRILRNDIDKGSRRETKLAEALLKESSDSGESVQSEQFMQKLKEINKSLSDNVRENHQMAETLHILTEERRALQHRIAELESNSNLVQYQHYNQQDLEERANHLFAKYMRSESFRKALVYQKRFLLITIASTSGIAAGKISLPLLFKTSSDPNKRKSFRTVVLMVIAIERMKYITRRWTGKRMAGKAIFTCGPKRSQSASNNNWSTFAARNESFQMINSPPSRDRPGFQLPSPTNYMPSPLTRIFSLPENVDRKRTDGLRRLFTTDENN